MKQTIIIRKRTECEFTAMMAATSTALPLQRQLRYIFIIYNATTYQQTGGSESVILSMTVIDLLWEMGNTRGRYSNGKWVGMLVGNFEKNRGLKETNHSAAKTLFDPEIHQNAKTRISFHFFVRNPKIDLDG